MVRKGQMHVMDAMAAIMILTFFGIAGFTPEASSDWSSYENQIAAKDLSHVFKETGYLQSFLKDGETGNIKTAISSVSERDLGVGGDIQGLPPNMHIGFHTMPSGLNSIELENVSSGDRCLGDLREINERSASPLLRTQASIENSHGDIRLYFGDYHRFTDLASETEYDAIWVTDGSSSCDISDSDDPVRLDEVFEWDGDVFEFRGIDEEINSVGNVTNATLELADAEQIQRFQQTFRREVGVVNNRIEIDSFTLSDEDTDEMDMLVFRQNSSIRRIEDGRRGTANQIMSGKPTIFLADLNSTMLESGDFLHARGLRWVDIPIYAKGGAECSVDADREDLVPGCKPSASFSSSASSSQMKDNALSLETDFSQLSLYPGGRVTTESRGVLSYEKPLYLDHYGYENVSENPENLAMSHIPWSSGQAHFTSCENVTKGNFEFPELDGSVEDVTVVNTQLGGSQDYCDRNSRAAYIDWDGDGDFDKRDEGPFLDGERLEVNNISYSVSFLPDTRPGCDIDDCLRFNQVKNADVSALNYIPENRIGRAAYEQVYSEADRKVLASFMYMMADSTVIPSSSSGDLSTDVYGVLGNEPYKVTLRWSN